MSLIPLDLFRKFLEKAFMEITSDESAPEMILPITDEFLAISQKGEGVFSERNFFIFKDGNQIFNVKELYKVFLLGLREALVRRIAAGMTEKMKSIQEIPRSMPSLISFMNERGFFDYRLPEEEIEKIKATWERVEMARQIKVALVGRNGAINLEELPKTFLDDVEILQQFVQQHIIESRRGLPSKLDVDSDKGYIKIMTTRFPDGEFNLRILNPDIVNNAAITIKSPLDNADDLVKIVLLMGMLRRYGAETIKLVLDKPYDIKNGLDEALRYFCDNIACRDDEEVREIDIVFVETIQKKKPPIWIKRVLYQHARLENDAEEAAASINAKSIKLEIVRGDGGPLDWNINVSEDLKDKNVILLHSTENSNDIAELWLMLIALRRAGVGSISLINTYEEYSRQDKVFNDGEGISADTMLKMIDVLTDNYMTLNVHYADKTGEVKDGTGKIEFVNKYDIYNLNAFVQIAEDLFDRIVKWAGKENLVKEFESHPVVLAAPDDGAFGYIREAANRLKAYIKKKYALDIDVHYGYMDKTRISDKEVKVSGRILEDENKAISSISNIKDCWIFVLDDETSWGTTLEAAIYALVRDAGVSWPRILTGVVHGKLARGIEPFETGWTEKDIIAALKDGKDIESKPEYIDEVKRLMSPRLFVTTKSVALPEGFPEEQSVSIAPIISHAARKIVGWKQKNIKQTVDSKKLRVGL